MNRKYFLPACIFISFSFVYFVRSNNKNEMTSRDETVINYFPLGDSYTIGEGAGEENSFPALLTRHLNEGGIKTNLVANPAVTGYTTQNLIDEELPLFKKSEVDFSTLLIGVNDWVQKVDEKAFQKNLSFILDEMQNHLTDRTKIILVTIPDFGVTENGAKYSGGRNISEGIAHFNSIVKAEAEKRKLLLVDIFALTQKMKSNPDLVAADGLHPSAKEYALWEEIIFPVAKQMLNKN